MSKITASDVFSKQELYTYKILPIPATFYLVENHKISCLFLTDEMCNFFGRTKEEIITWFDTNMYSDTHPDDVDRVLQAGSDFITGKIHTYNITYRTMHQCCKKYYWLHAESKFLKLDSDYRVIMTTYQNVDLEKKNREERKFLNLKNMHEYEEMQEFFKAIVFKQNDIILKFDEKRRIVIGFFSPQHTTEDELSGYKEISFSQMDYYFQINQQHVTSFKNKPFTSCDEALATVTDGKNHTATYVVEKNGEKRYKQALFFRYTENSMLFVIVYDVTKLIKIEHKESTKLKKAIQAKSEFLSRMSHDMRTPLGAIMAESEFGLEEVKDTTAQKYFAHIKESSQYLFSIINDILEQEKMDNGTLLLKRHVFELAPFNQSVKTIINQKAEEKNITQIISCNYPPEIAYVKLDESHLEQVLINLLTNAIKYTKENGTIEWGCDLVKKNGANFLVYSIKDNGVGMSESFQKSMFQPYSREKNALSSAEGGSGLGLSIVKRILDAGQHTITCQSALNKGSLFTIEIQLPLVSEEEKQLLQNKIIRLDVSKLNKAQILVVDDIAINRMIVQKILEKKGCIISTATNGLEAIDMVKKGSFDLVLMDIRMPVMNGLEAVKTIRLFNKDIPIIALSANAFTDDITISIKAGMNDHLAKPINRNKLMELLIKYLKD